ncbi:MAG: glutathione S-transferase N-terminal domain-containing protein [Povalibacter sp.]
MTQEFTPVAYIKEGCPYSMKFLQFIDEAQLSDQIDIVRIAEGTPQMDEVREKLSDATGDLPQFPTVEIAPGQFRTESNELIRYFADRYGARSH